MATKLYSLVVLLLVVLFVDVRGFNLEEEFDEDSYPKMFPDEDIFLSRRREDPTMDEESNTVKKELHSDSESVSFVSNLGPSLQVVVDGKLDTKNLPANYHNKTTYLIKHNNKPVQVTVTIDKVTNPKTGFSTLSVAETTNDTSTEECTTSSSCGKGLYCGEFIYGKSCAKCSDISKSCTSNEQCCGTGTSGSLCVNGVCQTGFTKGQQGTVCHAPSDCSSGLCCAREFMNPMSVCKPMAKIGERCARSSSGMNLIMDGGLCPCTSGLVCTHSDPLMRSIFQGTMEDVLGDTTCSKKGKTHRGNWFSSFFDDLDDEGDRYI